MKNNFHIADFNKTLKTNTRFMQNLEKKIQTVKKPGLRIYVTMNVLSNHSIMSNMENIEKFLELIKLINIEDDKFRLTIHIKGSEEKIYISCPFDFKKIKEDCSKHHAIEIKKIGIEYNLLYDAASDDARKRHNKSTVKE